MNQLTIANKKKDIVKLFEVTMRINIVIQFLNIL